MTIAFDIFPESIYFSEQDLNLGNPEHYSWGLDGQLYQAIPFPDIWRGEG